MKCQLLVATPEFLLGLDTTDIEEVVEVNAKQLAQASFLQSPQQALAVFYQPMSRVEDNIDDQLVLALDGVQDPGNLGTIIRLADWFGIKHIVCSPDTVDVYNPKTVQATMGAIARVEVDYKDLLAFLFRHGERPVYGTFLDGKSLYEEDITPYGIIVMGNEGNGIRPRAVGMISTRLYIPNYPAGQSASESLNVAIATAIVCAEFRRKAG
jgi:TrmH family RNA methyltransferase